MALPNTLKNFNAFLDGKSLMGIVEELKLPKLGRKMEDFRGGGMDGPVDIDLGQEKLEIEQVCGGFVLDAYKAYGITTAAGSAINAVSGTEANPHRLVSPCQASGIPAALAADPNRLRSPNTQPCRRSASRSRYTGRGRPPALTCRASV